MDCLECGNSGTVIVEKTICTHGCCGRPLPTGECCGNAIPVPELMQEQDICPSCHGESIKETK